MSNSEQQSSDSVFTEMELEDFLREAFNREFDDDNDNDNTPSVELKITKSAFNRRIHEFEIVNNGYKGIKEFFVNAFEPYKTKITETLTEFKLIKTVSYFSAEFERSFHIDGQSDPLLEKREIHIPTKAREINPSTDLSEYYQNDIINYMIKKVDEVMIEGSGFTLSKIKQLRVQIFKYEPLAGSGSIELPTSIKKKRERL